MSLPILCYHRVGPIAEAGRRLNVEPERLRQHIRFFRRRGYEFVKAADLAGEFPNRAVCLTFDDAYACTLTHGVEAMRTEGVTASIYAVTERVGQESSWDEGGPAPLANWDQLRRAQLAGFEIGNHTLTHPFMSRLCVEEQVREVREAHRQLEEQGLLPGSFCYPYGDLNTSAVRAVEEAGYGVAVTLIKRQASPDDPRLLLPRVAIGYSDGVPMVIYKLWIKPKLKRVPNRP